MITTYASNPDPKKRAVKKGYRKHRFNVLQKRQYYTAITARRKARLLHHALHRSRENVKNKLYRKKNKQRISIAKKARYVLTEPKIDVKEKYIKNMKRNISSIPTLK